MSDSVGSVSVEVVPDARGWSEKLRAQIRDQKATVKADADTTEAETQLDEVARTRTAKVKADVSQLSEGATMLDKFVGNLGLLPALAITAGSALIPLTAVVGGLVAALAAPLAIAGGGATLFALLGGAAISQTNKQLKVIDSLQKKLDGLTKGTAEYAQTQKALRDAQRALSPEQVKYTDEIGKLHAAFQNFLNGKAGGELLSVVNQGLALMIHLLPMAAPLISSVGGAFSTLLGDASKASQSSGFKSFIDQFARLAGRDIVIGGRILGDLAKGVGSLLFATDKGFSGSFLHGLHQLTSSFADWASSKSARKGMSDFFDYVHRVGPQVGDTVGAVARGIGHLVKALAPLGPPVLRIVQGLADAFSSIPLPVLTGIAGAAAGLVAFQKLGGFKATALLTKGLGGGGGTGGILGAVGVQKVYVVNLPPNGITPPGAPGTPGSPTIPRDLPGAVGTGALLRGLLTRAGPAMLGVTAGDINNEVPDQGTKLYATRAAFRRAYAGSATVPGPDIRAQFGKSGFSYDKARGLLGIPDIKSTGTAFDALRANAQKASRSIDMIGPHADSALGAATRDVQRFNGVLNSIHDKRFAVIADTANSIRSLERLQALRIADKSFTVYQRNQIIEQAVGPGGGIGRHNPGGSGGASGGSGGGAGTPVHIHLDQSGRTTLSGYMQGHAQNVYDQNQQFAGAHQ